MASDQDTYVVRKGVSPNTVSEISSKTKIFASPAAVSSAQSAAKVQVGVIAQFDPSESRSIEPIRGIGYGDQIAELIPGVTEPMSLSVVRAAQYLANMYQVFGYKGGIDGIVRSLKHHRWPFDINKETVFSEVVSENYLNGVDVSQSSGNPISTTNFAALITIFEGCWFQDWTTSYTSDSALVQENCTIMVSDVYAKGNAELAENIDTGNKGSSARFTQDTGIVNSATGA